MTSARAPITRHQVPVSGVKSAPGHSACQGGSSQRCPYEDYVVTDPNRSRIMYMFLQQFLEQGFTQTASYEFRCPMLRCLESFKEPMNLIRHLLHCPDLVNGEFECWECEVYHKFPTKERAWAGWSGWTQSVECEPLKKPSISDRWRKCLSGGLRSSSVTTQSFSTSPMRPLSFSESSGYPTSSAGSLYVSAGSPMGSKTQSPARWPETADGVWESTTTRHPTYPTVKAGAPFKSQARLSYEARQGVALAITPLAKLGYQFTQGVKVTGEIYEAPWNDVSGEACPRNINELESPPPPSELHDTQSPSNTGRGSPSSFESSEETPWDITLVGDAFQPQSCQATPDTSFDSVSSGGAPQLQTDAPAVLNEGFSESPAEMAGTELGRGLSWPQPSAMADPTAPNTRWEMDAGHAQYPWELDTGHFQQQNFQRGTASLSTSSAPAHLEDWKPNLDELFTPRTRSALLYNPGTLENGSGAPSGGSGELPAQGTDDQLAWLEALNLPSNHHTPAELGEPSPEDYKCPECGWVPSGKPGNYDKYLKKHRTTHLSIQLPCGHCSATYTRSDNLRKHLREKHRINETRRSVVHSQPHYHRSRRIAAVDVERTSRSGSPGAGVVARRRLACRSQSSLGSVASDVCELP